jgi:hypothetical protein
VTYSGEPQDLGGLFASLSERVRSLEARTPLPGLQGAPGPAGPTGAAGSGSAGGVTILGSTILSASAAAFNFSPIPFGYFGLVLGWKARSDAVANNVDMLIQFDGDTGAHYAWEQLLVADASTTPLDGYTQTAIRVGEATASSALGSSFGGGRIIIPGYGDSVSHKIALGMTYAPLFNSNPGEQIYLQGGSWMTTSPVTSIKLFPSAGQLIAGSSAWLEPM